MNTPKAPLIASYFTLAGNVLPLAGNMTSRVPLRTRIEAAAKAGFQGFGFMQDDLDAVLATMRLADVRAMLDDNGLHLVEIEVLIDWFCDGERRAASDRMRRNMLDCAAALGAHHLKIGSDLDGVQWPLDTMVEAFATLCDQAREAGTAVGIELLPVANLANLEQGMAVVNGAGRRNGGLVLDSWHMTRGHIDFAEIAKLPASAIVHVELDDGPATPIHDFFTETICHRELCGEGAFDLAGFLGAIRATGYDGTFGIELLSDTHRQRGTTEAAERAYATTRACLDRHFTRGA